ncbi:hypothetical protein PACTADRAFT_50095 [Pachysolen tannophilus NRRL Y-2460]|uniref:Centrosomin N-terminal motif 1 domain-containing protein n=1 Tax=Pachysolen tannophilus NRRL Y-2460 TaxID=669874 RepID=A0A1E4TUD8_PACTA|nr:hypothetical protein PACTADRAFT_50095 [Pachysolen tannophilus NRRL Y-2460]
MFGQGRLIGTPIDPKKGQRHHQSSRMEFTPIGHYDEGDVNGHFNVDNENHDSNFFVGSPLSNRNNNVRKKNYKVSPLANHTIDGSSYENMTQEFDTILATDNDNIKSNKNLSNFDKINYLNELGNNNNNSNNNEDDDSVNILKNSFLNNGSNPLRQQQNNVNKLQEENINLKVRLTTLTKYLNAEPQDKIDLINNNIELKQNLIEMSNEIENLKNHIQKLEEEEEENNKENRISRNITPNKSFVSNPATINHNDSIIHQELNDKLEDLKFENKQLNENLEELLEQIENLKTENKDLHEMVEQLDDSVQGHRENQSNRNMEKSREVAKLEETIKNLKFTLEDNDYHIREREQQINDVREMMNSLQDELADKNGTIAELKQKLNKVHDYSLEDVKLLKDEVIRLQNQELKLINDREDLSHELSKVKGQLENTNEHYEKSQRKVNDLIRQLKKTKEDANIETNEYLHKLEDERVSLYDELQEANDKIYKLERQLNSANMDVVTLRKIENSNKERILLLSNENEKLKKKMDKLETSKSSNNNKKDSIFYKERFEQERSELLSEINQLKDENSVLQKKIDSLSFSSSSSLLGNSNMKNTNMKNTSNGSNDYLESEIRRLSNENSELQKLLNSTKSDYQTKLSNLEYKNTQLVDQLNDKEKDLNELESKIRNLNKSNTLKLLNEDDEKLELIREKNQIESKLKLLNIEKSTLKDEYELKISILKKQLDNYQSNSNPATTLNQMLEFELNNAIRSKDELLVKLEKKSQENVELYYKYSKLKKDNKELEDIMYALEENEEKLRVDNRGLENRMSLLEDELNKTRQHCTRLANRLKSVSSSSDDSSSKSLLIENYRLELDRANDEIDRLNRNYKKMRDDLIDKCRDLQKSKGNLKDKVLELNDQLSQVRLKDSQIKNSYPSPKSSPSNNNRNNVGNKMHFKLNIAEGESIVLRTRVHEQQATIKDLQFYNGILNKSIKEYEALLKRNIYKIQPILENQSSCFKIINNNKNKKITFKAVAKMVLASIRLKNRLRKQTLKTIKLDDIKKEINRGKLELL